MLEDTVSSRAVVDGLAHPWSLARRPDHSSIRGETVSLEALVPSAHASDLFEAAEGPGADPELWRYMSVGPFGEEAALGAWLEQAAAADDPTFYAIVDRGGGRASGVASYLRVTPEHGSIEIGNIWFGPSLQRTRGATEAIFLLARNAFDILGYRRLEWKCDALNVRSRRAAERFGFSFEGIFRQHMIVKGKNRDTAWFAIVDGEWPAVRNAFELWLGPKNFTDDGRQVSSLSDLRRT